MKAPLIRTRIQASHPFSKNHRICRLSVTPFVTFLIFPPHSLFSPYLRCRCEEQVSRHSVFTGYLYFFKPTASRPHRMTSSSSSSSPPCAFAALGSYCRCPARGKAESRRGGGWGVWGELTQRMRGMLELRAPLNHHGLLQHIHHHHLHQWHIRHSVFCEWGEKEGGREKRWWYYDKAKAVHIYSGRWVELIQKPGCGCVTGRPCLKASDYI